MTVANLLATLAKLNPSKINVLFLWKAAERAPPLPLRSQDGARLVRVVSIVLHFIFFPFLVRHPGTFSALNSAGSVSVNALSTQSKCAEVHKCAVVDTALVFIYIYGCRCWRTDTSRHMTRCSPVGHRASVQKVTRLEVAQRSGHISLISKCDFQVAVRLNWRFSTSFKWWRPQLVCAQHPVFIFLHFFLFSFHFFLNASLWYCLMLLWQFVMMPLISYEKHFELPRWNMLYK